MAENPYTRSATVSVVELIPQKTALPICVAWKKNLDQCTFTARYEVNGNPCCGLHVGKPDLVFMPSRLRVGKEAHR